MSFIIDTIGQTDNVTASNTIILPTSVKITDSDTDEIDESIIV